MAALGGRQEVIAPLNFKKVNLKYRDSSYVPQRFVYIMPY